MNIRKTSIIAVLAAAAGLSLAACDSASGSASGSPSGGTAASSATAVSSPAAVSASTATSPVAVGTGSSAATSSGSPSGSSGGSAAGATARCHTSDLGFAWGAPGPSAAGGQRSISVKLTDRGSASCTLRGFPGVDLVNSGQVWSVPRASGGPRGTVTLAPGGSTSFTLVYRADIGAGGQPYTPTTAVITPPDETTSFDLPWSFGRLIKDSTTYVEPIG